MPTNEKVAELLPVIFGGVLEIMIVGATVSMTHE